MTGFACWRCGLPLLPAVTKGRVCSGAGFTLLCAPAILCICPSPADGPDCPLHPDGPPLAESEEEP